jgi:hypothetical protein
MNLHTNLMADIITAVSSTDVATVAGISNPDWTNYHIFKGQVGVIGGVNRGRRIGVYINRLNSAYNTTTLSTGTTDEGGQVDTSFRISFFACASSNRRHEESEKTLYALATTTVKKLRELWNFEQNNFAVREIQTYPFGYQIDVDITVNNTWNISNL